jgi:hypothetical protein
MNSLATLYEDSRFYLFILFIKKVPAADATDAPQPYGLLCNPVMKMNESPPPFPE